MKQADMPNMITEELDCIQCFLSVSVLSSMDFNCVHHTGLLIQSRVNILLEG